jgi:prevent-host-death family protein
MTTVDMQAAKTHLSQLVEQAIAGEEIVIARAGKPLVRLTPFRQDQSPRRLGILRRQIREASDCWENDPAIEAAFNEGIFLRTDR